MPGKVLIQAGHSPAYPPREAGGGGAPGEAEWTSALAGRITERLRRAGVQVAIVGAWLVTQNGKQIELPSPPATRQDWDLFLALHYDAAIYGAGHNTGAFADHAQGEPRTVDSERFIAAWEARYFRPAPLGTGLANMPGRRNANTRFYYGYRATTNATPSCLIEHGVGARGAGEDAVLLHDQIDLVAQLDAAAILDYLGINTNVPEANHMAVLNDDELFEVASKAWNLRGVPCVRANGFYQSWVERLRAGDYRGLPQAGEQGWTGGTYQPFDRGLIVWKNGEKVSWEG